MPPCSAPPPQQRAVISQDLLQPCPKLKPLVGKDGIAVTRKLVEVGDAYNDCADSKAKLIGATSAP